MLSVRLYRLADDEPKIPEGGGPPGGATATWTTPTRTATTRAAGPGTAAHAAHPGRRSIFVGWAGLAETSKAPGARQAHAQSSPPPGRVQRCVGWSLFQERGLRLKQPNPGAYFNDCACASRKPTESTSAGRCTALPSPDRIGQTGSDVIGRSAADM